MNYINTIKTACYQSLLTAQTSTDGEGKGQNRAPLADEPLLDSLCFYPIDIEDIDYGILP